MNKGEHFSHPHTTILQMGLQPGHKVGEFGAGSGHVAMAAAGVVGDEGRVYAIDIQRDVLTHLADTLRERGITNVDTIWGDVEILGGARLRDNVLDAVIISNTLFQIEKKEGLLAEVKRVLKPLGKLLVTDWAGSYGGIGPHPDHVVTEHDAEDLFIGNGFHKVKSYRSGPYHYSLLFVMPEGS